MVELKTLEKGNDYTFGGSFGSTEFSYRTYLPVKEKREAAEMLYTMQYKEDEAMGLIYETIDGFLGTAYVALKYFTNIDIDEVLKHSTMDEIYDFLCHEYEQWISDGDIEAEMDSISWMVQKILNMRTKTISLKHRTYAKVYEILQMMPTRDDLNESIKKDNEVNVQLMNLISKAKKYDTEHSGEKVDLPKIPKLNFAKR